MIGSLHGTVAEKRPNRILVDVNGVGYAVQVPLSTYVELGPLRSEVSLLIHTHVREDALTLYGFLTAKEKSLFEQLLKVTGIGPNLAITLLSGLAVDELVPAIRRNDLVRLTAIPGIGRKTAERIVVELRDKVAHLETGIAAAPAVSGGAFEADVASALLNLGYPQAAVEKAVAEAAREASEKSFDAVLREALQRLTGRRARAPMASRGAGTNA
ncbi:MAG TPA: Holliday junction branch migration protein RuvA [Candidatus Acidoferrales bacterium]